MAIQKCYLMENSGSNDLGVENFINEICDKNMIRIVLQFGNYATFILTTQL